MTATRKARVPMSEQIRLIGENRRGGATYADWYREQNIAPIISVVRIRVWIINELLFLQSNGERTFQKSIRSSFRT